MSSAATVNMISYSLFINMNLGSSTLTYDWYSISSRPVLFSKVVFLDFPPMTNVLPLVLLSKLELWTVALIPSTNIAEISGATLWKNLQRSTSEFSPPRYNTPT